MQLSTSDVFTNHRNSLLRRIPENRLGCKTAQTKRGQRDSKHSDPR